MKIAGLMLFFISITSFAQEPVVYHLNWVEHSNIEKVTRFVSISDQYQLSEDKDSSAIPVSYLGTQSGSNTEYIVLEGQYRQRCLDGMNIINSDIVSIYDYVQDRMLTLKVAGLKLVAVLSPYSHGSDYPLTQSDYMIGFEIDPLFLKEFTDYYSDVLVSIGKTNPFKQGKMKAIKWIQVDSSQFPINTSLPDLNSPLKNVSKGDTYKFEMNGMTYLVQNIGSNEESIARHAVILKSKVILFEHIYQSSEWGDMAMLNYVDHEDQGYLSQYSGQLFKNQPPVIFGFMYHSFGCPSIEFIHKSKEKIYINCDNRH